MTREESCLASITLLSREANLHGRDARATWHGHLAHAALMSLKPDVCATRSRLNRVILVSAAKLQEPYWLRLSGDFGSPRPNAGEGLEGEGRVRGCARRRFSQTTQEAHPMGHGVDSSLTPIPLNTDPSPRWPRWGEGSRELHLGINSTPVLLSDFRDRN